MYLYDVSSRLVNVRLDEDRLRKVNALRKQGIALSDLLRAAIDEGYERALARREPRDVRALFARLDAEYPILANDLPRPTYDVHDRHRAAAAIRRRLDRRRRKPRNR